MDGVSKTYAMTGWRIGWALAPAPPREGHREGPGPVHDQPDGRRAARRGRRPARRQGPRGAMGARPSPSGAAPSWPGWNGIDGVRCREPEGAFYAFPNVQELIGRKAAGKALDDDLALT
ncbi:MAG: pyridoxal phosphate-dependent aminotransferase, partial [Sandaracinaceae bacterium]|nr:pyridoxal phosphate-dependent aminotransferase [Sandaracinaceae bacterium]